MHFYPHHIGDYQRDTASLSVIEHGAYRLLMDAYYVSERPLPDDLEALCRICRAFSRSERKAVEHVAALFFKKEPPGLTHKRIIAEIAAYASRAELARRNGRCNGKRTPLKRPSAPRSGEPSGLAPGHPEDTQQDPVGSSPGSPEDTQQDPGGSSPGSLEDTQQDPGGSSPGHPDDTQRQANQEPGTNNHGDKKKKNAGAGESDPDSGTWPELTAVIAYASTVLAPPECAEYFWNYHEQLGWEVKGQPICDWRAGFRNFATTWKANHAQRARVDAAPPPGSPRAFPPRPPRHPAYNAATATAGLTQHQIFHFMEERDRSAQAKARKEALSGS